MGAGNVKHVYAYWRDLADGPFRVLAYMALVSLDDDDPPRFWGGRETLALATGRMVADKWTEDPDALAERRRAFKAVDRMLSVLTKAGAAWVISPAHTGRQAVYGLHLKSGPRIKSTPPTGVQSAESTPVNGVQSGPGNGSRSIESTPVSGQEHPAHRGPEEYEEQGKTQGKEESGDLHTAVTVARAREAAEDPLSIAHLFRGPTSRAQQAIAEAQARRAAAIAAQHAATEGER